MEVKCKLCGKVLESGEGEEKVIPFNIASGDESSFKLAEVGNNFLILMNHLLVKHPDKAMEIYSDLNSKLSSIFEIKKGDNLV